MHRPEHSRFEFADADALAVCEYRLEGRTLDLHHTFVPDSLRGRGIAAILAKEALDYAKAQGLRVIPTCSYIATYIARHREYAPLLTRE